MLINIKPDIVTEPKAKSYIGRFYVKANFNSEVSLLPAIIL